MEKLIKQMLKREKHKLRRKMIKMMDLKLKRKMENQNLPVRMIKMVPKENCKKEKKIPKK